MLKSYNELSYIYTIHYLIFLQDLNQNEIKFDFIRALIQKHAFRERDKNKDNLVIMISEMTNSQSLSR